MSLNGKKLGEFRLDAYQDGDFIEVTHQDLLGKWSVLFFYPADFTFVCPTELADLAERYADFQKAGCEVYSVSCDTHYVHMAWHESSKDVGKVIFPMVSDPTGRLAKELSVYDESTGQTERGTFVINPEGEVVLYEVSAGNIGRNAEELLRKVEAAQFVYVNGDEVCPAKWHPGERTLKPALVIKEMQKAFRRE